MREYKISSTPFYLLTIFVIFQLPENRALSGLCQGMIEAWNLAEKPEACILFVIEDVTFNICDQVGILLI